MEAETEFQSHLVVKRNHMLKTLQSTYDGEKYNYTAARKLFAERFPNEYIPSRQSFRRTLITYKTYGVVIAPRKPHPRPVTDGPLKEKVLKELQKQPEQSMRALAKRIGGCRESVRKIVKSI